jgi:hypothetical protein
MMHFLVVFHFVVLLMRLFVMLASMVHRGRCGGRGGTGWSGCGRLGEGRTHGKGNGNESGDQFVHTNSFWEVIHNYVPL